MLPLFFCVLGCFMLKLYSVLEKLLFILFFKAVKAKISTFCKLNSLNKGIICVMDKQFFLHFAQHGLAGFPKAFAEGWIEVENLELAIKNVISDRTYRTEFAFRYKCFLDYMQYYVFFHPKLLQKPQYYELDKSLFRSMLGPTMIHSIGSFLQETNTLEQAQINKLNEMASLLQLQQGKQILDIGCGWGGAAKYFAENFGVSVSAITNSVNGYNSVTEICANLPVSVHFTDCSQERFPTDTEFNAAYALMMLMCIRPSKRRAFFQMVANSLEPGGLFFLQLTMSSDPRIPLVSGLVNPMIGGISMVYHDEFVKAYEGIFRLKYMRCVNEDTVRTETEWLARLKENRAIWVDSVGEEVTCFVEMIHSCEKVVHEMQEAQVFNVLLERI